MEVEEVDGVGWSYPMSAGSRARDPDLAQMCPFALLGTCLLKNQRFTFHSTCNLGLKSLVWKSLVFASVTRALCRGKQRL